MHVCCGYILESNEYPQHMFLWRTRENYPSIIPKYPPFGQYKLCGHFNIVGNYTITRTSNRHVALFGHVRFR